MLKLANLCIYFVCQNTDDLSVFFGKLADND